MSKGDENLDQLVKDAFGAEQHEFAPAYWQEAQQMLNANQVATTAFYTKPIFIIGSAILLIASIGLYSDSTDFNKTITSEVTVLEAQIEFDKNEKTTQVSTIENIDLSINKTKELLDFEKKNVEPVSATPFDGMTSDSKSVELNTGSQISESTTKVSVNPTETVEIEDSNKEPLENSMPNSERNNRENDIVNVGGTAMATAIAKSTTRNRSVTKAKLVNPSAEQNANEEVAVLIEESAISSSRISANSFQLAAMQPRGLMYINDLSEESTFIGASEKKHKKLNKPVNLRISAGKLWGNPMSTESALVQNKYRQNSVEISLEYMLQKHWGVQIGATWSQSNVDQSYRFLTEEDNSYWEENQVITEVNNQVWWLGGWYNYPNTYDTTLTHELINVTDTVSGNKQINHRIQMIEIPVLITYNYGLNRFNIQLSTGVSFGAIINAKGNYFASEDPFVVPVSSSVFNSFQTSFLLRSELAYGLNDHWWISAQPQLKLNLNTVYPKEATVAPKSTYYGVSLGIIYKF